MVGPDCRSLCDRTAGDAVSRVSRRICLHVVRFGMNYEGCSTIAENRVTVTSQIGVRISHCGSCGSICLHRKVRHVTRVRPFGVVESVLLSLWIEMTSSRFEVGRFTLRGLMNVNRVLARRQILQIQLDIQALLAWLQSGRSNALAFGIFQFDSGTRRKQRKRAPQQRSSDKCVLFHAAHYSDFQGSACGSYVESIISRPQILPVGKGYSNSQDSGLDLD